VLSLETQTPLRTFELDVSLEVDRECLSIVGPSGAGKTTLLRIVAGLARPSRGRVACGGELWLDTDRGVSLPPERRSCGYMFQEYALFPHLRAWENVAYGLRHLPKDARRARAHALLARLGVEGLAGVRPAELSGGEGQRVALARAIAREPSVFLLDEPLAALDARSRAAAAYELQAVLRDLERPALIVSHDFLVAAQLGNEVLVIEEGRIVQRGSPAELAGAPRTPFVADVTGASVLTGTARPGPEGLTAVELDGGGRLLSTDVAAGRVAASVLPWEVTLELAGEGASGPATADPPPARTSAQNRVPGTVSSVVPVDNRVRVRLLVPQPLVAEVTASGAGARVTASWKATATRLSSLEGPQNGRM
jgi:molybdate transport system ATP-binding protein